MSPKNPDTNNLNKMEEIRVVSCITEPGSEPQDIKIKIPEPTIKKSNKKLYDKDFYKKTSSLDRRDRYLTMTNIDVNNKKKKNPMLDRKHRYPTIIGSDLTFSQNNLNLQQKCPLEDGLDLSLAPWPGMKWSCVRILHLYCKIFDQFELFELIVR